MQLYQLLTPASLIQVREHVSLHTLAIGTNKSLDEASQEDEMSSVTFDDSDGACPPSELNLV